MCNSLYFQDITFIMAYRVICDLRDLLEGYAIFRGKSQNEVGIERRESNKEHLLVALGNFIRCEK